VPRPCHRSSGDGREGGRARSGPKRPSPAPRAATCGCWRSGRTRGPRLLEPPHHRNKNLASARVTRTGPTQVFPYPAPRSSPHWWKRGEFRMKSRSERGSLHCAQHPRRRLALSSSQSRCRSSPHTETLNKMLESSRAVTLTGARQHPRRAGETVDTKKVLQTGQTSTPKLNASLLRCCASKSSTHNLLGFAGQLDRAGPRYSTTAAKKSDQQ